MRIIYFYFGIFLGFLLVFACHRANANFNVLIIDTGVQPDHPAFKDHKLHCFSKNDCIDQNGHGTAMASFAINGELSIYRHATSPICNEAKVYICNYKVSSSTYESYRAKMNCFRKALSLRSFLVSFSSSGPDFDEEEYYALDNLSKQNTIFVTSTGNEGLDLAQNPVFPAMYRAMEFINILGTKRFKSIPKIVPVSALTKDGQRYIRANRAPIQVSELGTNVLTAHKDSKYAFYTGTSVATALHSNRLIRQECIKRGYKVPDLEK